MGILTVVTPASNQELTTAATVKTILGISGSSEDAKIPIWIKQVSAAVSKYCNRVFLRETVSELYRRNPDSHVHGSHRRAQPLVLTRNPVSSVVSVTEDGITLGTGDYEIDGDPGLLNRLCSDVISPWQGQKVVVQYIAGYASIAEIADVEQAVITLISHVRAAAGRDPAAKAVEVTDVDRVEYWVGGMPGMDPSGWPQEVVSVLKDYAVQAIA